LNDGEVFYKTKGVVVCKSSILTTNIINKSYPYGVLPTKLGMVEALHFFLGELFKSIEHKLAMLENEVKVLF
jgi:hypothetical protein